MRLLKQLTCLTADLGPIWAQIAIFGLQGERLPTGGLEKPSRGWLLVSRKVCITFARGKVMQFQLARNDRLDETVLKI